MAAFKYKGISTIFCSLQWKKKEKKHFRNCFKNRKIQNAHKMGPHGNKSLTLKS
jgi:hypothetical protein